jgi:lipoic acid synthetase
MECYSSRTATFMILGSVCTRNCRFCNVNAGEPEPVDPEEPAHIAGAVRDMGLKHVVITSVTRDDLGDGGAGHFAAVVEAVRERNPGVTIEVLIPDFQGEPESLKTVVDSLPEIINHNIETVPRLYPDLRPRADYFRSLDLLKRVRKMDSTLKTKSGIMVGAGESYEEVVSVLHDLRGVYCDYLTIGQYLSPSKEHHPVMEWITPETFDGYRKKALSMGFKGVASSPLVRSSYHAADMLES